MNHQVYIPSLKSFQFINNVKYFSKAKKYLNESTGFYFVEPNRKKRLIALTFGKEKRKIKNLIIAMKPINEFNKMIIYYRVYFQPFR